MEQFRLILDEVIGEDTAIAEATFRRYQRLDQLRLLSEQGIVESLGGAEAVGTEPRSWNPVRQAREELVFEVSCALRVPQQTAATLLWEAKVLLHDLPQTANALSAGEISPRHASVMIGQVQSIPDDARGDFELAVLPFAKSLTVSRFTSVARKKRESLHPDSMVERHGKELSERRVWVTPESDGMAYLTAYLSAEVAYAAYDRLTQIAEEPGCDGDDRHHGQKRADAFADLLLLGDTCSATDAGELMPEPTDADATAGGLALSDMVAPPLDGVPAAAWGPGIQHRVGHGIRPKVLVTVPVLTLIGSGREPGALEGYGPIDQDTARELAGNAPSFTRILVNPVTSSIVDIDRATYAVPADLRLALRVQDETCRSVNCNRPAAHCDIDHNVDYAKDGKTQISNLCHLCPSCHRRRHHTRIAVRNLANGDIEWTTPSGKVYTTHPMNRLAMRKADSPDAQTQRHEERGDETNCDEEFPF
ncbi:MAG: hypothetical protein JWM51_1397 [Microbacteriaceae bacterium]|nr:hypothetical protein [Microbacteriaceae bacterium]